VWKTSGKSSRLALTSRRCKARDAEQIGDPTDGFESERIEWVPLSDIRPLIAKGDISSGTTMVALLCLIAER